MVVYEFKFLVLDKEDTCVDFSLDGQIIEFEQQFEYLGYLINTKSDNSTRWKSKGLNNNLNYHLKIMCLKMALICPLNFKVYTHKSACIYCIWHSIDGATVSSCFIDIYSMSFYKKC